MKPLNDRLKLFTVASSNSRSGPIPKLSYRLSVDASDVIGNCLCGTLRKLCLVVQDIENKRLSLFSRDAVSPANGLYKAV